MQVDPFSISIEQASIDELNRRVGQTRWPDEPRDAGWSMGTNLDFMRKLAAHWLGGYDWRAQERALNRLPQFKADVDGQGIHLFHSRAAHGSAMPLLLLHGWPDSNFRFAKVVPQLADAARG